MHERSVKNEHLDTLRYEIDTLRHCEATLNGSTRRPKSLRRRRCTTCVSRGSRYARFTNRRDRLSDLAATSERVLPGIRTTARRPASEPDS
jgi:hypothetical protein